MHEALAAHFQLRSWSMPRALAPDQPGPFCHQDLPFASSDLPFFGGVGGRCCVCTARSQLRQWIWCPTSVSPQASTPLPTGLSGSGLLRLGLSLWLGTGCLFCLAQDASSVQLQRPSGNSETWQPARGVQASLLFLLLRGGWCAVVRAVVSVLKRDEASLPGLGQAGRSLSGPRNKKVRRGSLASPPAERAPPPDAARTLALAPSAGMGAPPDVSLGAAPLRGSEGTPPALATVVAAAALRPSSRDEERGAYSGEGEVEEGAGEGAGGSGKSGDEDEEEENLPLGGEDYQQGSIGRPGELPLHACGPGGLLAPGPGGVAGAGAAALADAAALLGAGTLEMLPAAVPGVGGAAVGGSSSSSLLKAAKRKKDKDGAHHGGSSGGAAVASSINHVQGQSTAYAPASHHGQLAGAPGEDLKGSDAFGPARAPLKKILGSSKTKVVSAAVPGRVRNDASILTATRAAWGGQPRPPRVGPPSSLLSLCRLSPGPAWVAQQKGSGGDGPFSPERDRTEGGAPRLKGVQFPFSVNDRVLIKVGGSLERAAPA